MNTETQQAKEPEDWPLLAPWQQLRESVRSCLYHGATVEQIERVVDELAISS